MKIMSKISKIIISLVLIFTITSLPISAEEKDVIREDIVGKIEDIITWKKSTYRLGKDEPLLNQRFLENAGDTTGDWYLIGMGRIGYEDEYDRYLAVIQDKVEKRYREKNKLSDSKATEWHRISLAILAAGGDPTTVGEKNGTPIHLIADGTYDRGKTRSLGTQGINGWIWGLITLDSLRYIVPEDAHDTRNTMIEEILKNQLQDGGFSLNSSLTDPDITAMAIQALAPYYNSEETYSYKQKARDEQVTKAVREVVDEALEILSEIQLEDGDFESWERPNAESTAQVIVALTTLGIDPLTDERFIKNGNTLLDGIVKYQRPDGGFIHSEMYDPENPTSLPEESNSMASEQVLYALVSMYRFYEGYRTLYDFREEMSPELTNKIKTVKESIDTIPDVVDETDKALIEKVFRAYLDVPVEERSYIVNYHHLANAMKDLGIPNTSEPLSESMGIHSGGTGSTMSLINNQKAKTDTLFSEEDMKKVTNLPDEITTEYYVEVISLIDKLQHAPNQKDYEHLLKDLQVKKEKMEKIEMEIESINNDILQHVYPFQEVSLKDKKLVEQIVERYHVLSPYDQNKVQSYEDVEKAETKIHSMIRARIMTVLICLVVMIMSTLLIVRYKKRKQEKKMRKMMDERY